MKKVYLLKNTSNDEYKIGISVHPQKRLKEVQTGNASEIIICNIYESEYANKIEKALHSHYSYVKKMGEWFTLSLKEELEFINECKRIENNIKILIDNGNKFI
jgi:hypothetical protein